MSDLVIQLRYGLFLTSIGCFRPAVSNDTLLFPDQDWYIIGDKVRINCTDEMKLDGNQSVICGTNETWQGLPGICLHKG